MDGRSAVDEFLFHGDGKGLRIWDSRLDARIIVVCLHRSEGGALFAFITTPMLQ